MRLWSIHPKYLDQKGLVALWREALLAQKVLEGRTKGYKNHPQLIRFKKKRNPSKVISSYLHAICDEADRRGYKFDRSKIKFEFKKVVSLIKVTEKQLICERNHLKTKLQKRDPKKFKEIEKIKRIIPHPIFKKISGEIESWEKNIY